MSHESRVIACVLVLAASVGLLSAQCPAPVWSAMNAYPGANDIVYAETTWDPDGPLPGLPVLVFGGKFTVPSSRIGTWDGVTWQALGTGLDGEVRALTVFNGQLVAGGNFTTAGGTPASCIASWDGSAWHSFGSGMNNTVFSLTVYNGSLYAGGLFTTADGVSCNRIARWTGSTWQPVGTGFSGPVLSLSVFNSELIAGGDFSNYPILNIARWNGIAWQAFGLGAQGGEVRATCVWVGELIATGSFQSVNSVAASRIAKWNGTSWQPLGTGLNGPGHSLAVINSELVVGGEFGSAGGNPVNRVARWNGSNWQAFGTGVSGTSVYAVAAFGSDIYVGGSLTGVPGYGVNNVAVWNGSAWDGLPGINGLVSRFAIYQGDLVMGGTFTRVGVVPASGLARWNGATWQPFGAGVSLGPCTDCGVVNAILVNGSDLVVAGAFTEIDGVTVNRVARFDGTSWHGYGAGVNNGTILAATFYNGDLVVAGFFTNAGGTPIFSLARWDGASWVPIGAGFNGYVRALGVYAGELVAAGTFSMSGTTPVNQIARWNGSTWLPLGAGVNGTVRTMRVYKGDLVVGGSFATVGGSIQSTGVARWDGTSWHAMGIGNSGVGSMEIYDGDLFATATTWALPSGFTSGIARWDGSTWQPVGAGLGGPSSIITIPDSGVIHQIVYHDELLLGGVFSTAGGLPSAFFAKLTLPVPRVTLAQAGPGAGAFLDNGGLMPGHEYYNVVSLDLSPEGPGTGFWGGLSFLDPSFLFQQLAIPLGEEPFHFLAANTMESFGPFGIPPGLSFEVLCGDATGGVVGCLSSVTRYTTR